jgi:hypothetical protein
LTALTTIEPTLPAAPPRPDPAFPASGPVFRVPWEAQGFAMAAALHE